MKIKVKYVFFIFQAESPASGRFTALGFYLLTSMFFVVIGIIQFAYIIHLCHIKKKRRYGVKGSRKEKSLKIRKANEIHIFDIRKVDNIAFKFVVSSFIIFNILYWVIFLTYDFNPSLEDK